MPQQQSLQRGVWDKTNPNLYRMPGIEIGHNVPAATHTKGHLGQSKIMPLWNPLYSNRTLCLSSNPYKGVSGTKQTQTSMETLQRGVWDKANPHLYGTPGIVIGHRASAAIPTKRCLIQSKPTSLWNPYKGVSGTKQTHTSMEPLV